MRMINEITKAIAFFESAIQEGDKIRDDCSNKNATELAEQKKHFVVAVDAMLLILSDPITALRLERECEAKNETSCSGQAS